MDYSELVNLYEALEKTSKRLEKTEILSNFLKKVDKNDFEFVMYLLQGRVFPSWDERKIGMSSRIMLKVIARASGVDSDKVEDEWRKIGDLGMVSEELIRNKKQRTLHFLKLKVEKVFENIRKLAELEGKGTVDKKINLIAELLSNATPLEAKYITRTILETLRIGVADGVIRDAIAKAFDKDVKEVQRAFDASNDFSKVVLAIKEKTLGRIKIQVGIPIKVMLALKEETIEDAFERTGRPAEIEHKIDGFRLQVHKSKNEIKLFTRRLENVSEQFKDVVEFVKKNVKGNEFILDCEAVGYDPKTKKYVPFQNISQRIKRKYSIEKMMSEVPVELNVFDVIYYNGKNFINEPFKKRRELIKKIIKNEKFKIKIVEGIITDDNEEAEKFYNNSLEKGMEGLMFKTLDAPYKPGARVGYMIKLKGEADTLDLVITGATWGEGKRASWLSSFELSCKAGDKFLAIGKVGTGVKEKNEGVTFEELTNILKPLIMEEKGKEVVIKPKIVVEVAYQEIQKSPSYSSGYALRFPRVMRLRYDKGVNDADSLIRVRNLYKKQ